MTTRIIRNPRGFLRIKFLNKMINIAYFCAWIRNIMQKLFFFHTYFTTFLKILASKGHFSQFQWYLSIQCSFYCSLKFILYHFSKIWVLTWVLPTRPIHVINAVQCPVRHFPWAGPLAFLGTLPTNGVFWPKTLGFCWKNWPKRSKKIHPRGCWWWPWWPWPHTNAQNGLEDG